MPKCSKCAEDVPENVSQCPWCGAGLNQASPMPTGTAFTPQQKKLILVGIIGGIVLLLLIVAIVNSGSGGGYDDTESAGNVQTDTTYQYFYDLGQSRAKYYDVGDRQNMYLHLTKALNELPVVESVDPYAEKKKDAFMKGWTDYYAKPPKKNKR